MLGSPTIAPNPLHARIAACPVLLVLVTDTWAANRRRSRLGVIHAIQAGATGPASRRRLVRAVARWGVTPTLDLGLTSIVADRSRAFLLIAALTVTCAAVVFALFMQASLNAAPAGQVSDAPDSLPILFYTLDVLLVVIPTLSLIAVALLSVRERKREFGCSRPSGSRPARSP
jgi:hypothetical protein